MVEYCCECGSPLTKTEDDEFEYYKCDICNDGDFVISKELMKKAIYKNRGVGSQSRR